LATIIASFTPSLLSLGASNAYLPLNRVELLFEGSNPISGRTFRRGSVDAVTLVTNIPAIATKLRCTNVANYKGFGMYQPHELQGIQYDEIL